MAQPDAARIALVADGRGLLYCAVHINPDHFLQTGSGRITTPELNERAWARSFDALEAVLRHAMPSTKVYVLVGAQGAGKSTWVRSQAAAHPHAVFFDAILVKRVERERVLAAARRFGVGAIAVWLETPLEVCLARNASRPADEVVHEQAVRNVFAAIEPPSTDEGFERIWKVPDRHAND